MFTFLTHEDRDTPHIHRLRDTYIHTHTRARTYTHTGTKRYKLEEKYSEKLQKKN